ncbi:MAG TPA: amidohydrolase, partial [Gemmatimonadaceae bacterium]
MSERQSRRDFMGRAAAGMAGMMGMGLAMPDWLRDAGVGFARTISRVADADLVVLNAKVYTMNPATARADAFAVQNGRFVAIGKSADMKSLIGKGTQTFDAKGMTVVPGFIDCHNHAGGTTLLYDVLVGNPYEVEFVTVDSIVDKLKAKARETSPGMWVDGYFFDDTKLKDKRMLNRHDLDRVSTAHPVCVHHRGGHTSFYNTKALEMAGITKDTPNPAGGTFDRDANGELNGRVTDRARGAVDRVGKRPTFTPEQRAQRERDGVSHISKQFVRYGLTSVHHEGGDLDAIRDVHARGELKHRVSYEASGRVLDQMIQSGIKTGAGDEWIKYGATSEHTVDGSFSERTMALSTPYAGVEPPYKGNITETQDTLNAWAERVHRAGIQLNCHANGDVAIDMTLTAYEHALKAAPRADARPKITHCTLINDDLIRRMKAMGLVPAPFTSYAYYNTDKFKYYGEDLMKRCMAYRTFIDNGIIAAAGSDFSPGPFDARMGIQGMVTRTGWDGTSWGLNQRITVDEAIRVNTINGAYAS